MIPKKEALTFSWVRAKLNGGITMDSKKIHITLSCGNGYHRHQGEYKRNAYPSYQKPILNSQAYHFAFALPQ